MGTQRPKTALHLSAETPTSAKEEEMSTNEVGTSQKQKQTTAPSKQKEDFVNDGPFSFISNFMGAWEDGKTMNLVVPGEGKKLSEEEAAKQTKEFTNNLQNIGIDERERRRKAGDIMKIVTAVYVIWASLIGDNGDLTGHFVRFMSVVPLFFAVGLQKSAEKGLWNIAQAGKWEANGTLEKIEDRNLARAILDKVNNMNIETGLQCTAIAAAYAALPQSMTASAAFFAVLYGALYFVQGKIPNVADNKDD